MKDITSEDPSVTPGVDGDANLSIADRELGRGHVRPGHPDLRRFSLVARRNREVPRFAGEYQRGTRELSRESHCGCVSLCVSWVDIQ